MAHKARSTKNTMKPPKTPMRASVPHGMPPSDWTNSALSTRSSDGLFVSSSQRRSQSYSGPPPVFPSYAHFGTGGDSAPDSHMMGLGALATLHSPGSLGLQPSSVQADTHSYPPSPYFALHAPPSYPPVTNPSYHTYPQLDSPAQPVLPVSPTAHLAPYSNFPGPYLPSTVALPDPFLAGPTHLHAMNADALAAEATAVLAGREEQLSAALQSDARMEDALDADTLDPFTPRRGHTVKRQEEPPKNEDGKLMCRFQSSCAGITFDRRCEWSKHMDKHERPYKCEAPGCEKLQGFTYSGGLLRHQREVHKMHGGNKDPLFCPFSTCKRSQGEGFTRKENRDEHVRRVHRRATDGSEVLNGNKRPHDAIDATDALLAPDLHTEEGAEDITADSIDVTAPPLSPAKKRRVHSNGAVPVAMPEADSDVKGVLKRLQESNAFLLQQLTNLRRDHTNLGRDFQQVVDRMNRLEEDLGSHLVSGACPSDDAVPTVTE